MESQQKPSCLLRFYMLIGGETLQPFLRLASIKQFGLLGPLIMPFDN